MQALLTKGHRRRRIRWENHLDWNGRQRQGPSGPEEFGDTFPSLHPTYVHSRRTATTVHQSLSPPLHTHTTCMYTHTQHTILNDSLIQTRPSLTEGWSYNRKRNLCVHVMSSSTFPAVHSTIPQITCKGILTKCRAANCGWALKGKHWYIHIYAPKMDMCCLESKCRGLKAMKWIVLCCFACCCCLSKPLSEECIAHYPIRNFKKETTSLTHSLQTSHVQE